jgi:hypothetical protein
MMTPAGNSTLRFEKKLSDLAKTRLGFAVDAADAQGRPLFAGRDGANAAVNRIGERFAGNPAPSDCGRN